MSLTPDMEGSRDNQYHAYPLIDAITGHPMPGDPSMDC